MKTVYVDPVFGDDERRSVVYDGQLVVHGPRPAAAAMLEHTRAMLEAAFPGGDPLQAQFRMPVEEYAARFGPLKRDFIHHPDSWRRLAAMLVELGCDPEKTYLDVPRLRVSTADGYLTSGVAYAHHPHRDTWYSAPLCQLNWWVPVYDIVPDNAMAFHPRYWSRGVENDSDRFNYYEWNMNQRKNAAQHVKSDTRWQPHALEPLELEPEVRVICGPGSAIVFSAAQLHSTVPNTSGRMRYSFDVRTVHIDDVRNRRGAANVDSAPTGTSLRDFKRIADGAPIDDDDVALHDARPPEGLQLVFAPT